MRVARARNNKGKQIKLGEAKANKKTTEKRKKVQPMKVLSKKVRRERC